MKVIGTDARISLADFSGEFIDLRDLAAAPDPFVGDYLGRWDAPALKLAEAERLERRQLAPTIRHDPVNRAQRRADAARRRKSGR